jgi:hypothetical protein
VRGAGLMPSWASLPPYSPQYIVIACYKLIGVLTRAGSGAIVHTLRGEPPQPRSFLIGCPDAGQQRLAAAITASSKLREQGCRESSQSRRDPPPDCAGAA